MKTIIEMAREAGLIGLHEPSEKWIKEFSHLVALVRADERERFRVDDLEMLLRVRAEQIVNLQDEIRNLTGEE